MDRFFDRDGSSAPLSARHEPIRHLTRNWREGCVMARAQRAGLRYHRCFAVARYASWEAAEAAARLWLRPVLAKLALLPKSEIRPGRRNRSGVVGVFFRPGPCLLKNGRLVAYPAYVARWPGAPVGVKWMFRKSGGEDGAFLRACLSRELKTADRVRVEWALRALSPERRAELIALKRPPTPAPWCAPAAEAIPFPVPRLSNELLDKPGAGQLSPPPKVLPE